MSALFFIFFLFISLSPSNNVVAAAYFKSLGINFGQLGNDLPSASTSISRILRLRASAVKIYDANPSILRALSYTHLTTSIMLPNDLIPSASLNRSFALSWIQSNILPFYPNTRIRFLLVGNEILSGSPNPSLWPHLVPAILNIHKSLKSLHIHKIKVGTTLAMDALTTSSPPSSAAFRPDIALPIINPLLKFLTKTNSYYFVDAYSYFPWSSNPTNISLDYALFTANSSHYFTDPSSNLTYTNLFDELLDSVVFAMRRLGYGSVRLCVAETGWPNAGDLDQIGANVYNAATYNRNLAERMRARPPIGTPARPGAYVPVFVFALYNENEKPGPGTERHWGVLYPNGTGVYQLDLTGERTEFAPLPPPTNDQPYEGRIWCVVAAAAENATAVGEAVSYACGQGKGTCEAIQKGGPCYEPNSLGYHASYAFNSYWQQFRKSGATCYFGGLALQTTKDPSYGKCKFPSLTN